MSMSEEDMAAFMENTKPGMPKVTRQKIPGTVMTGLKQDARKYAKDMRSMLPWIKEKLILDTLIIQYWVERSDDKGAFAGAKLFADHAGQLIDQIDQLIREEEEDASRAKKEG